MRRRRPGEPEKTRRVSVYIPARYTLRPSRAERVVPFLLMPLTAFLMIASASDGPVYDPAFYWLLLLLGGLLAFCPVWALKNRAARLEVDGERLVYCRWRRPEEEFFFSGVACVEARRGREAVVLWDERRQALCRLKVTMDGLGTLLADLRSRGIPFLEEPPKSWDRSAPPSSPGPRKEVLELDLPARVPDWYCLRHPALFTRIFAVTGAFFAAADVALFWNGDWPVGLCFLLVPLGVFGALVLTRREKIESLGDRLLWRPAWGAPREISLSDVAAVRIQTNFAGLGTFQTVRLLNWAGEVCLSPGPGMTGTGLLMADLIDRGIPFTY